MHKYMTIHTTESGDHANFLSISTMRMNSIMI